MINLFCQNDERGVIHYGIKLTIMIVFFCPLKIKAHSINRIDCVHLKIQANFIVWQEFSHIIRLTYIFLELRDVCTAMTKHKICINEVEFPYLNIRRICDAHFLYVFRVSNNFPHL